MIVAEVRGLSIRLPGGAPLLDRVDFSLRRGEVVSLLGPSGAGKSTLLRGIFDAESLQREGYAVAVEARHIGSEPGYVPQRGALLDHLDVGGNITLAQAGADMPADPKPWLRAVGLGEDDAFVKREVGTLSGGQAQRLAVARVLAAGRSIVIMDEPSVGLDPVAVRQLARLLIKQARRSQIAVIVITHDLTFAAGASDRLLYLDPARRTVEPLLPGWTGPAEFDALEARLAKVQTLEETVEDRLLADAPPPPAPRRSRVIWGSLWGPVDTAGEAIRYAFAPRLFIQSLAVLEHVVRQALFKPALFYAIAGALLGFTIPYIIVNVAQGLRPSAALELLKGSYIVSLAPPLSAILFAATSGSAIAAWLGGLRLHGQVSALEGLAVPPKRYLWAPSWVGLMMSYQLSFMLMYLAMIAGGWVLFTMRGVPHPFQVLTADLVDPPPHRMAYVIRALWSWFMYSVVIASVAVDKGRGAKARSSDVTAAMTASIRQITLVVVVFELVSMMVASWGSHGG